MKRAEEVTFGGSGLDRAAHIRKDTNALDKMLVDGTQCVVPLWRGKLLCRNDADGAESLVFLGNDSPVLAKANSERIFLGLDEGTPRFAADISDWEPLEVDEMQIDSFLDRSEQVHPSAPDGARFLELRNVMTLLTARDAELAATARAVWNWHKTHLFCSRCGQQSDMADGGWVRKCASCGGHHFPRTDPVVIMLITHGNDVLLGRSPHWPEGMYSLLAGFIEPGETIEAAVRREVFEESGIRVGQVDYLASQPWPYPASLMFGCKGDATSREITVDPEELEDAIWISREDMLDVFAERHSSISRPRNGAIAGFLLENWLADRLD